VSGGKDSSYLLFYVVKELRLRPLAIFFDNGFVIDMAKRNVDKICDKLGVDLVIGKATDFRRKLIVECLKILTQFSIASHRVSLCGNCENNLRTFAINEATRRKIPFIIWGSTDFEDSEAFSSTRTFREEYGTIRNICRRIVNNYLLVLLHAGFLNTCKLVLPGLRYFYFIIRDNIKMKAPVGWYKLNPFLQVSFKGKNVEVIYFYDYIQYDPYKQIEILQKNLDWESPSDRQMRMDCKLHVFHNYWSLKNQGITSDGLIMATLVRKGLLSREDAMKKEKVLKQDLEKEYSELIEELARGTAFRVKERR